MCSEYHIKMLHAVGEFFAIALADAPTYCNNALVKRRTFTNGEVLH